MQEKIGSFLSIGKVRRLTAARLTRKLNAPRFTSEAPHPTILREAARLDNAFRRRKTMPTTMPLRSEK